MNRLLARKAQASRCTRRSGKHADGRTRMPALPDMLRTHAFADARTNFVAGDGRPQEIAAVETRTNFCNCKKRRQSHRTNVQHTLPMHIVELKALNKGTVDQRRMRRG